MRAAIDAAHWVDGRVTASQQGQRIKNNRQWPQTAPLRLRKAT